MQTVSATGRREGTAPSWGQGSLSSNEYRATARLKCSNPAMLPAEALPTCWYEPTAESNKPTAVIYPESKYPAPNNIPRDGGWGRVLVLSLGRPWKDCPNSREGQNLASRPSRTKPLDRRRAKVRRIESVDASVVPSWFCVPLSVHLPRAFYRRLPRRPMIEAVT